MEKIATVTDATSLLKVSSNLPSNKCITYSEMLDLISESTTDELCKNLGCALLWDIDLTDEFSIENDGIQLDSIGTWNGLTYWKWNYENRTKNVIVKAHNDVYVTAITRGNNTLRLMSYLVHSDLFNINTTLNWKIVFASSNEYTIT